MAFFVSTKVLFDVLVTLFAVALASQRFLYATLFAGLQVIGVTLYLFDNVLLLDLPLEPAQRAFKRLAILDDYFGQVNFTPFFALKTHTTTHYSAFSNPLDVTLWL